jgi:type IV pilus assembly protein PilY1
MIIVLFLCFWGILWDTAAHAAVPFRAFWRETTYPLGDTVFTGATPNVLFLLDDSPNMTVSLKGQMPVFLSTYDMNTRVLHEMHEMQTKWPIMRDASFRAGLLKDLTYGIGARTVSMGTQADQAARRNNNGLILPFVSPHLGTERTGYITGNKYESDDIGYTRWGRDVEEDNNIIGDIECYYSPDPNKPYVLTFRDRVFAEWNGAGSPPSGFPNALTPYLPGGGKEGLPVPLDLANQYLVPNDSKMYKMKLVLWRILSPDNADMLSRMKLGVASSFADLLSPGSLGSSPPHAAPTVRRAPFKRTDPPLHSTIPYYNPQTDQYWAFHNGTPQWTSFSHGTAPLAYSGIYGGNQLSDPDLGIQIEAGLLDADRSKSEVAYSGLSGYYFTYPFLPQPETEIHSLRAMLRVPFDFMYSIQSDGAYRPSSSLISFRELIDGIEQIDFNTSDEIGRFVNEELFPASAFSLALPKILYGHDYHVKNGANQKVLNDQWAVTYTRGNDGTFSIHHGVNQAMPVESGMNLYPTYALLRRFRNQEGLMTGTVLGSVQDFFAPLNATILPFKDSPEAEDTRGYFPITGACQNNWVVLFTGGENWNDGEHNPQAVEALSKLYLSSNTMRGRKWTGEKWDEEEYSMDQPIRTMVVGMVSTEGAAQDGNPNDPDSPNDTSAKRLRKAIRLLAQAGQPFSNGTPNPDVEPYFADNVPDLIKALQSILLTIQTESYAASAPVVLPLYENIASGERSIFASSYELRTKRQWKSSFVRYDVPSAISADETLKWEAHTKMNNDPDRPLYTTTEVMGTPGGGVTSVSAMSDSDFAALAGVPNHANEFKNWLIAYSGEDGVFGEMEHSGITVVGEPILKNISDREMRIYLQTNRGVLHSLTYEEGDEAWAFIPPNVFQHRLRAQKFKDDSTWLDGDGEDTIASRPLVLLDGMLSPSDITVNGVPQTYMIGAMGWGGNGIYAMDITEAGSVPTFLWAVDNVRYADVEPTPLDGVKLWGAAATGNKTEYDYSDLGLTIVAADLRRTESADVGILPGGLGYKLGEDNQGKAFYVFDPQNGKIIKKISTGNGYVGLGSMGMGITPVSYIARGEKTEKFYTGDSEGNVLTCDTTLPPKDWTLTSIFRLRGPNDAKVALTKAMEIGQSGASRWLFSGTSDLMVPDFSLTRKLENPKQYIFGLNLNKVDPSTGPKPPLVGPQDLAQLKYLKTDPEILPSYGVDEAQTNVTPDAYGWLLELRPAITSDTNPTDAEYVTTSPFLHRGVLYVATFIPRTRQPSGGFCSEMGDGKLYALDPTTGLSMWKDADDRRQQARVLPNIKIVGISASQSDLFLGIKVLQNGALASRQQYPDLKNSKPLAGDTILRLADLPEGSGGGGASRPLEHLVPHLQYWREFF